MALPTREELLGPGSAAPPPRPELATRLRTQAQTATQQAAQFHALWTKGDDTAERKARHYRRMARESRAWAGRIAAGTGDLTQQERIGILKARFPGKKYSEIKRKALPFGSPERARVIEKQQEIAQREKVREAAGLTKEEMRGLVPAARTALRREYKLGRLRRAGMPQTKPLRRLDETKVYEVATPRGTVYRTPSPEFAQAKAREIYLRERQKTARELEAEGYREARQFFPEPIKTREPGVVVDGRSRLTELYGRGIRIRDIPLLGATHPVLLQETPREAPIKGFERRVTKSEAREKGFFEGEGFERIKKTARYITTLPSPYETIFKGERPHSDLAVKRSFVGETAENVLTGLLAWPIAVGGLLPMVGEKLTATAEAATIAPTREKILPEAKRAFKELEKGPFSFLPGGTPITPEGASTLAAAGLFGLFALPGAARTSPVKADVFTLETAGKTRTIRTVGVEAGTKGQPLLTIEKTVTKGRQPTPLTKEEFLHGTPHPQEVLTTGLKTSKSDVGWVEDTVFLTRDPLIAKEYGEVLKVKLTPKQMKRADLGQAYVKSGSEAIIFEDILPGQISRYSIETIAPTKETSVYFGTPRFAEQTLPATLTKRVAQPETAVGAKAFDRALKLTPAEVTRGTAATRAASILKEDPGLRVKDVFFRLETVKDPLEVTRQVEQFAKKEGGVFFGSGTTQQLPTGFQNIKIGDIDTFFPTKTPAMLQPKVARLAEELRATGEQVRVSPKNPLIIEKPPPGLGLGEKIIEVKSGLAPSTLGEELAPAGFRGIRFPDIKAGQQPSTVPFGEARAIKAGEQFARKGAASLIVRPASPEAAPGLRMAGVLGKAERSAKDLAGFIQSGKGLVSIRQQQNIFARAVKARGTVRAERALGEFIESFTPQQQAAIRAKLTELTGKPTLIPLRPGTGVSPKASPFLPGRSSGLLAPFKERPARPSVSPGQKPSISIRYLLPRSPSPRVSPRPRSPSSWLRSPPRSVVSGRPSTPPRSRPPSSAPSPQLPSPSPTPSLSPSPIPSISPKPSSYPSPRPSPSARVSPSPRSTYPPHLMPPRGRPPSWLREPRRPTREAEPSEQRRLVRAFLVQVKQRGEFQTVGKGLTRAEALQLGKRRTLRSLAATFRLKETGQLIPERKAKLPDLEEFFRTYKVRRGKRIPQHDVFIQRRAKRLSTPEEVLGIQRARRRKRREVKFL